MKKNSVIKTTISMKDACKKLNNLKEYFPVFLVGDFIYPFGKFLASKLQGKSLSPQEFYDAYVLAINELQTGINASTGEKFHHDLVGCSPPVYFFLLKSIKEIARTVLPKKFAKQVRAFDEEYLDYRKRTKWE